MTTEDYLNKPYWVVDILPQQVPADSPGQYFTIEKYYLEHPQIDLIYRKFTNILLKLNCYYHIDISTDGDEWTANPAPHQLEAAFRELMANKQMLYFILRPAGVMITLSGDDTNMTVYNPSDEAIALIRSIAASEALFFWKP